MIPKSGTGFRKDHAPPRGQVTPAPAPKGRNREVACPPTVAPPERARSLRRCVRAASSRWMPMRALSVIASCGSRGLVLFGQGAVDPRQGAARPASCSNARSPSPSRPGTTVKPWSWADTWPVARIEVPRLNESAIVLARQQRAGARLRARPRGADARARARSGTAIYSAHRDTHFAFLGDVRDRRRDRSRAATAPCTASASRTHRSCAGTSRGSIRSRAAATSCSRPAGRSTRKVPGPLRYLVHAELMESS